VSTQMTSNRVNTSESNEDYVDNIYNTDFKTIRTSRHLIMSQSHSNKKAKLRKGHLGIQSSDTYLRLPYKLH
jgi:hypothetical protein